MTNPPSRFTATPAEVDAYLRAILAEDTYLRYQQAIGEHVLGDAVESAGTVRASADNDGLYNADWREGWDDAIARVDPDENGPCPSKLVEFPAAQEAYVSHQLPPRDAVCARPSCGHPGADHHHGDTKCWAHLPRTRDEFGAWSGIQICECPGFQPA